MAQTKIMHREEADQFRNEIFNAVKQAELVSSSTSAPASTTGQSLSSDEKSQLEAYAKGSVVNNPVRNKMDFIVFAILREKIQQFDTQQHLQILAWQREALSYYETQQAILKEQALKDEQIDRQAAEQHKYVEPYHHSLMLIILVELMKAFENLIEQLTKQMSSLETKLSDINQKIANLEPEVAKAMGDFNKNLASFLQELSSKDLQNPAIPTAMVDEVSLKITNLVKRFLNGEISKEIYNHETRNIIDAAVKINRPSCDPERLNSFALGVLSNTDTLMQQQPILAVASELVQTKGLLTYQFEQSKALLTKAMSCQKDLQTNPNTEVINSSQNFYESATKDLAAQQGVFTKTLDETLEASEAQSLGKFVPQK